jgi:hypothetical protein
LRPLTAATSFKRPCSPGLKRAVPSLAGLGDSTTGERKKGCLATGGACGVAMDMAIGSSMGGVVSSGEV